MNWLEKTRRQFELKHGNGKSIEMYGGVYEILWATIAVGMLTAVAINNVRAAELKRHEYPSEGFSAEFSGEVRRIDLKPNGRSSDYIFKTSIYEQHGDGYSYSVTAREYRLGIPNLSGLAQLIRARLHCSGKVRQSQVGGDELTMSGSRCLSSDTEFFARLLSRGRWFYQALAVVPQTKGFEGARFVAALRLTSKHGREGKAKAKRPKNKREFRPRRHAR
jgi:hypothetical protein